MDTDTVIQNNEIVSPGFYFLLSTLIGICTMTIIVFCRQIIDSKKERNLNEIRLNGRSLNSI